MKSGEELTYLDSNVTDIIIDHGVDRRELTELVLSGFQTLCKLEIGDECFPRVDQLILTGMHLLNSVIIGMNSFTKKKNGYGSDPNRHFYLKNCPKLMSLKMGRYSFSDYASAVIESNDALEVIEMGDLNEVSVNFAYASLELKSVLIHVE